MKIGIKKEEEYNNNNSNTKFCSLQNLLTFSGIQMFYSMDFKGKKTFF